MRITAFSDVCLRVVMLLTTESELLTSRVVSERVGTPYNHVSKAIIRVRELGLVHVERGRSGGVRISAAGRTATVGWLMRQLDDRVDLASCHTPAGPCPLLAGCGLRGALSTAREAFYAQLDDLVIADLAPAHRVGAVPITLSLNQPGS